MVTDEVCPAWKELDDERGVNREVCAKSGDLKYVRCSGHASNCERSEGPPDWWVRRREEPDPSRVIAEGKG